MPESLEIRFVALDDQGMLVQSSAEMIPHSDGVRIVLEDELPERCPRCNSFATTEDSMGLNGCNNCNLIW